MQIKLFNIPIVGGEALTTEMNAFLRSRRILEIAQYFGQQSGNSFWCFAVKYLEGEQTAPQAREKDKTDYRKLLSEPQFERFAQMRAIRKQLAEEEAVPAYAIFTNEELAAFAKIEPPLAAKAMLAVPNVGAKKVEKYARHFLPKPAAT